MPCAAADLANVDPILVSSLKVLHLVSSREIAGFLPLQRQPIPGAPGSRGAHLQADPALTLADGRDRAPHVRRWLCQIAADAGLTVGWSAWQRSCRQSTDSRSTRVGCRIGGRRIARANWQQQAACPVDVKRRRSARERALSEIMRRSRVSQPVSFPQGRWSAIRGNGPLSLITGAYAFQPV
jgi:hypothetical protein